MLTMILAHLLLVGTLALALVIAIATRRLAPARWPRIAVAVPIVLAGMYGAAILAMSAESGLAKRDQELALRSH